jgi:excisionase family DNA binding protein
MTDESFDLRSRIALRPAEAAKALGVSERTLRRMLPELPHVRRAGAVLLPLEPLRRWLEEQAQAQGREVDVAVREGLSKLGVAE